MKKQSLILFALSMLTLSVCAMDDGYKAQIQELAHTAANSGSDDPIVRTLHALNTIISPVLAAIRENVENGILHEKLNTTIENGFEFSEENEELTANLFALSAVFLPQLSPEIQDNVQFINDSLNDDQRQALIYQIVTDPKHLSVINKFMILLKHFQEGA